MDRLVFDLQLFVKNTLLSGTADNDTIRNWWGNAHAIIDAGAGDDYIYNDCSNVTINAGAGNDEIYNKGSESVITSGTGNDTLKIAENAKNVTITDFDKSDTLKLIGWAGYDELMKKPSFAKFANNILNIDGICITLPNVTNINNYRDVVVSYSYHDEDTYQTVYTETTLGELLDAKAPYWKLSGTTATYYDANGNLLVTLTGLKSGLKIVNGEIEGIYVDNDDNIVLSKSVLDKSTVSLITTMNTDSRWNPEGFLPVLTCTHYKLSLANDVTIASFPDYRDEEASYWTISGNVATYKVKAISGGYYFGTDKKKIRYIAENEITDIVKITGIKNGTTVNADGTISGIYCGYDLFYIDSGKDECLRGFCDIEDVTLLSERVTVDSEDIGVNFCEGEDYSSKIIFGTNADNDIKIDTGNSNGISIDSGKGDDYVVVRDGTNHTVSAGNGNDVVGVGNGSGYYVDAGNGNDIVAIANGSDHYIDAGDGDDFIVCHDYPGPTNITINGGKGDDDIIIHENQYNVIQYTAGDGKDIVEGFNSSDTLRIAGSSYSTIKDGDNLIVKVGSGSITLIGVSSANIVQDNSNKITWTVSGTKATGKIDGKVVATITGLKKGTNASALSDSGNVITIADSALTANAKNTVKLTKGNYALALGGDATESETTPAGFYIDGTTATYKTINKTAGYSVAANGKSISYIAAVASKDLATITGLSENVTADDLIIDTKNKKVTVKAHALGTDTVTITGGYNLALNTDVTKSVTTPAKWAIDGEHAEYTTAHISAGYVLAANKKSITFNEEFGGEMVATLDGLKKGTTASALSVKNNVIYVNTSALSQNNVVTLDSEDYTLAVGAGTKKSVTTSEGWIISGTTASYTTETTSVGYGVFDDGKTIEYVAEVDGGDIEIKLTGLKNKPAASALTVVDNVVTIGANAIAKTAITATGDSYEYVLGGAAKITSKSKNTTLTGSAGNDTLVGSKYADYISGGAGSDNISGGNGADTLIANGGDTLRGGLGDDILYSTAGDNTLSGGSGADKFYFTAGNDTITDYAAGKDKIYITGTFTNTISGRDVKFSVGSNTLTVKNGADKKITVNDSTQKYSATSGLFAEDNLSEIVADTSIGEFENYSEKLTQENLITYAK